MSEEEEEAEKPDTVVNLSKSKNKDYFRQYYHDNVRQVFTCEFCKCEVIGAKSQYNRHIKSKKCKHIQAQLKCLEFFKTNTT